MARVRCFSRVGDATKCLRAFTESVGAFSQFSRRPMHLAEESHHVVHLSPTYRRYLQAPNRHILPTEGHPTVNLKSIFVGSGNKRPDSTLPLTGRALYLGEQLDRLAGLWCNRLVDSGGNRRANSQINSPRSWINCGAHDERRVDGSLLGEMNTFHLGSDVRYPTKRWLATVSTGVFPQERHRITRLRHKILGACTM